MLTTKALHIAYLAHFVAGPKDVRYYLQGFHAEPHPDGGALLVAADGYAMLVIHDEEAEIDETAIYPISPELLRAVKRKGATDVAFCDGSAAVYWGGDKPTLTVEAVPLDGEFPQWAKVAQIQIEAARDMQTACCMDVELLSKLKCFALNGRERNGVVLRTVDASCAMLFLPDWHPNMWGLIMPMRGVRDLEDIVPAWLEKVLPAPEKKPKRARRANGKAA